jgi:hypothetical protein
MIMFRRCLLAVLLFTGAAAGVARATTLAHMSVEELTAAAQVVARVRCIDNSTRWENGEIWTLTTFDVIEVWKGHAPARITVRLIGGRAGHLVSTVADVPRFVHGEELILFLESKSHKEFSVTSWAQGTFRIRRDAAGREIVSQDTAGYPLFDPATRRYRSGVVRRLPLEEFRGQVVAAETQKGSGL